MMVLNKMGIKYIQNEAIVYKKEKMSFFKQWIFTKKYVIDIA